MDKEACVQAMSVCMVFFLLVLLYMDKEDYVLAMPARILFFGACVHGFFLVFFWFFFSVTMYMDKEDYVLAMPA